ncbi:thioesterase family protein [Frateuria aurantia]
MTSIATATPRHYFKQLAPLRFAPTSHVGGGWNPDEQHIAPIFGLLTHLVEAHRDERRGCDLGIARLSFDILGVLAMAPFDVELDVLRPGRTIELVEARVVSDGRTAVILRAWLMSATGTASIAGDAFAALAPPEAVPAWDFSGLWPGGFVRSVEARHQQQAPGRGTMWLNTSLDLIEGVAVSPLARMMGLVDAANGAFPRVSPQVAAFPNLDLTAHLLREPVGAWIGLDITVGFGPDGRGLTHSHLHDAQGLVGVISQSLTVRPLHAGPATTT